ncbi:MAG: hypothetical protein AAGA23_06145 [Pseudomonadota bacterium]
MNGDLSGVRDFDFLIGKWRVRHQTLAERLKGATEWREAMAIDVVRPAFAGLGNVGCFLREVDEQPFGGIPIRLYDPTIGLWRIYWLDSLGQRMEPPVVGGFRDGEGLFEGDDELRGRPIRVRYTWSDVSDHAARWTQSYSPDEGRTWELNSIMTFSRDNSLPDVPVFPLPTLEIS